MNSLHAVDLHRLDIERCLADQVVEERRGAGGGGARVGAHAAKLRDQAHGLEFLDREAGLDGDAHMIDLHHLAGLSPAGAAAPALGVAVELAPPLGLHAPVVERDRLGLAGADQAGDHASGGGGAGREAALARQHGADLGAPPQRKALPRPAHQLELASGPLALPKLVEQRELVEALGGLRRKFVADRSETAESAVRIFDLHGAFSHLSAVGL